MIVMKQKIANKITKSPVGEKIRTCSLSSDSSFGAISDSDFAASIDDRQAETTPASHKDISLSRSFFPCRMISGR